MTAIYKSDYILSLDDLYDIQEQVCCFGSSIQYQLTDDELGWLDFIRGKYCIADYIADNMTDDGVVTIDNDISKSLDDDCGGWGKATMLSDDTALQKLIFWVYEDGNECGS